MRVLVSVCFGFILSSGLGVDNFCDEQSSNEDKA